MLTLYHNTKQYPLENTEYYVRELANGLDEVIFSLPLHDPIYAIINEEEQITDRAGQTYKVKQIDAGANDAKIVCQLDIDVWRATLNVDYDSGTKTCYQQIQAVLPTGWSINDTAHVNIGRTLTGDLTPYDVCVECTNTYNVYIRWNNKTKVVTIYPKAMGTPIGSFATRELNLKEINYKGKSNDIVTRLYAYGKDGLSFASINGGKAYVDNFSYTSQIICGIWRDDRYEVKQNLLDDATEKLAQMSKPQRTYECSIVDLQATNPELYNNLDFSLFTAATLIDDIKETSVDYQVVERHVYPYHPELNEVIFNSEPLKITTTVTNVVEAISSPNSTFQQIQQQKIENATAWLTSGDGYVVAKKGSNGQWSELLFMDTDDESTAQNVLRINTNGLGFSTHGINGPYTNAWTIDGNLVADFITTGTMLCDRLKGGTLTLGGTSAGGGNGAIEIRNASNNIIATIDKNGITYNNNAFKVDNQGKLTATGASIKGTITVGGSNNTDGSITINNASGSAVCTINNNGINYGNGAFKVNALGALTATGADVTGKIVSNGTGTDNVTINNGVITATTGVTAKSYGISGQGDTYISDLNGGTVSAGHLIKSDGAINAGGAIATTNGNLSTSSGNIITADGYVSATEAYRYAGYSGSTDTWTIQDRSGNYHSLTIKGGIIVGTS